MMRKSLQGSLLEASQKTDTNKRKSLQDIKSLLEDRGGIIKYRYDMNNEADKKFVRDVNDKDKVNSVNNLYGLEKKVNFGDTTLSDNSNNIVKCNSRHTRGGWCFSRFKTMMLMLIVIVFVDTRLQTEARSTEPRYETAYACEGKTLKIGCSEGSVIHLIRANYGRFSITICNDHGNTDWSVNCMSTKSLRVLHSRCSMQQNCSILASTNMFGDPCPNTLKYLEAHYQCVPASTTSTTNRPSPPWLITSQPTVWRSTAPPQPKSPVQQPTGERKKPTVITPPTFRPHITLPPEVKIGDVGSKKTTTKLPETPPEMLPPPPVVEPKVTVEVQKVIEPENRPRNDKPSRDREDNVTEESPQLSSKDDSYDPTPPIQLPPPKENIPDTDIVNDLFPSVVPNIIRRMYCPHVTARGLNWNWTLAGTYAVQPCPGGATGLARWKCVVTLRKSTEEDRPKRRGPSLQSGENYRDLGLSLQSGENFRDLGLNEPTLNKQMQRLESLGNDALLKGRDELEHRFDYRASLNLPQNMDFDKIDFEWHGATPDLSGCRSVWLNSLEARVREGESLLSISNDLAQVTSSKTLYGGDLMTTTSIMKKLAENMKAQMRKTAQTFPDPTQREAVITDMLLGIIKTGSNLLDESQHSSWADLNQESQNLAASALLTHLEENAFLLADAVAKEKKILQIVKNICLSVRVLEVKNVKDETFPSPIAQEQWKASEDLITIPKAALLDNRQDDLVRIVFFAFDRLEQILPPVFGKAPVITFEVWDDLNTDKPEKEKRKIERVLNSKVISASLGNGRHIQLSQKVQLTLKHLSIDNVTNPMCVFWDYTMHGWSTEGCVVEWTNLTHTGCGCWHLTNFAILMDVHEVKLDRAHDMALGLLTIIGCAISSVALFAAIIVFQCFRNMKTDRVFIHKNLCCCLLMAEVIFMVGINQTENRVFCGVIAGLLHYFFLAAFAWMFLEGFHLYAMLVEVFEPERPRVKWYCAGAYLAPAFVVLVSAGVYPEGYGTPHNCWLSTDHLFVMSFVGPVAVVLVANWICLGMVIYMMCRHSTVAIKAKENSKLYKLRVWLNSSLVLAFLLGLTWTFGLLYLNEQTVVMAYIFTILNSLQGLIIFIFHCLLNEQFQKECANLARRYTWLSCCQVFAGQPSQPIPNNAPTASSSNHVENRQGSVKSRRYHQSGAVDSEDVVDPRDVTNTASKHHPGGTATLPHHDTLSRQMAQQNHLHAQYGDCDGPPVSPRHAIKDEESPLHHPHPQGYNTTRSYNHDFRNHHVYMSQHSPGSQEMIFRKHYKDENRRKHHHHHGSQNMNHTYSEIASQQGRIYRRGSEQEFRVIQDDPVYEEIERNETLMSDVSDDNSGPENGRHNVGHHGSSGSKFYGDHRPLISYSPGERHQHDQEHYGKYGKWDTLERAYDPRVCESGRLMHPYHQPQESNMRAFAAVLNGENNVVCHLEPHNSYDVYQPQAGNPRTVSQPSF